jgi:hypothetical protein
MVRSPLSSLLAFIPVLFLAGCSARSAPGPQDAAVVAVVNEDTEITFAELQEFAVARFFDGSSADRPGSYRRALDRMIMDEVRWLDFFERDLHRDRDLLRQMGRVLNEELALVYFQKEFVDRYINEESIQNAHRSMARAVHTAQIYVPKSEGEDFGAIRRMLADAETELAEGADPRIIADRLTEALSVNVIAGAGEPVTWSRSLTNEVEQVLFETPVGGTHTFESDDAFMLARVTEVENLPLPALPQVRDRIVESLRHRYIPHAVSEYEQEKARLVDASAVEWNPRALTQLLTWARTDRFFERDYQEIIDAELSRENNFLIATTEDRRIDLAEYKRLVDEVLTMTSGIALEMEDIQGHILEALRVEKIAQRARERGLERFILNPETDNAVIKNRVVRLYDQRMIASQLPVQDETALRAFFEANTDSLFYQFETVNAFILQTEDAGQAADWASQIESGRDLETVTGSYLVRSFYRGHDGDIRSLYSTEPPYLGSVAFDMAEGEVRGPVEYKDVNGTTYYAMIKNDAHRTARVREYEEVSDRLPREFRRYHWSRLEEELRRDLQSRYAWRINEAVLERQLEAHDIR